MRRLKEVVGEDWQAVLAAHPDGTYYGPHRNPPTIINPLTLAGYALLWCAF
jgi:hypothetical protein